jgi:hypothetical protein
MNIFGHEQTKDCNLSLYRKKRFIFLLDFHYLVIGDHVITT